MQLGFSESITARDRVGQSPTEYFIAGDPRDRVLQDSFSATVRPSAGPVGVFNLIHITQAVEIMLSTTHC